MQYRAVPHSDFYYLVKSEFPQHKEEIIITVEEYNTFLKSNQKYGHIVRAYRKEDGSLDVILDTRGQQAPYEYWDVESGTWEVDLRAYEETVHQKYKDRLEVDSAWASTEITLLEELVELDLATDADKEKLSNLKRFRASLTMLSRGTDYPNISKPLPERP